MRKHPRVEIRLSARVRWGTGSEKLCTIRDFCPDGMLVTWGKETELDARSPANGDPIEIRFSLGDRGNRQKYALVGTVARVFPGTSSSPGGAGVVFNAAPAQVLAALTGFAQSNPAGPSRKPDDGPPDARTGQNLGISTRRTIGALLERFAIGAMAAFLETYRNEVDRQLDSATDNRDMIHYLDAAATVARARGSLPEQFSTALSALLEPSDDTAAAPDEGNQATLSADGLALVEVEEFEIWLTLAGMANRTESRFQQVLYELEQRLTQVFGDESTTPYSAFEPAAVYRTFRQVTDALDLALAQRQHVLESFERAAQTRLGELYKGINLALLECGVLPQLRNRNPPLKAVSRQRPAAEVSAAPSPDPPVDASAIPSRDAPAERRLTGHGNRPATDRGNQLTPEKVLHSLLTVFDASSALLQNTGPPSVRTEAGGAGEPLVGEDYYKEAEVRAAVQVLEKVLAEEAVRGNQPRAGELRPRVVQTLEAMHPDPQAVRRLSPEEGQKVALVDALTQAIIDEAEATEVPALSELVSKLQAPLLAAAFATGSSFLEPGQPIQQLLNGLERAAAAASGLPPSIRDRQLLETLHQIADRLAAESDADEQSLLTVAGKLQQLIEPHQRMFTQNAERVIQAYEGRQRLAQGRAATEREIAQRAGNGALPGPVQVLWDQGWSHLLQLIYLRQGVDSTEWRHHLALLDAVLERLRTGEEPTGIMAVKTSQELIQEMLQALEAVGSNAARIQSIGAALRGAFEPQASGESADAATIQQSQPESTLAEPAAQQENDRWARSVRNLTRDDWLRVTLQNGDTAIGRIVWIAPAQDVFVLADRRGLKLAEFPAQELMHQLQAGDARELGKLEEPLLARIAPKIMSRMQLQITHQATHDELTGLLTRSEFERRLHRTLGSLPSQDIQGCLCHFHLDHLDLVNNACGYRAGDAMIAKAAATISNGAPLTALVGRLGAEDFGVYLADQDQDIGFQSAESLREAIQVLRFECANRRFMTTASVGLLHIASSGTDADSALTGAATACHAAKTTGRNRIHIFRSGSRQLAAERSQFDLVGLIDQALDEQSFRLRCQPIVPIAAQSKAYPYYEILLMPPASNGKSPSAFEVIKAAEAYDRIGRIDRWVVTHTLEWISQRRELLHRIGGFSINLSGASLNDPAFSAFLFGVLQRSSVPADKLNFEVTETAAIDTLSSAADLISEIRELGYGFFLDDFGTGFASFEYLRDLPFDKLKIDGSFVRSIASNPKDLAIVRSMNEVAHFLGKGTVAEFVDNETALQLLREIGVDYAQGYHLSPPFLLDDLPTRVA